MTFLEGKKNIKSTKKMSPPQFVNCVLFTIFFVINKSYLTLGNGTFDSELGYCAPYNGRVCKSFITSRQVFYSRNDQLDYGWENEKITTGLWDELIAGLHGMCRAPAEVCLFIFQF